MLCYPGKIRVHRKISFSLCLKGTRKSHPNIYASLALGLFGTEGNWDPGSQREAFTCISLAIGQIDFPFVMEIAFIKEISTCKDVSKPGDELGQQTILFS